MSAKTIALLLCRAIAIVIVVNVLQFAPMWVSTLWSAFELGGADVLSGLLMFIVAGGIPLAISFVLWTRGPRIAARAAADVDEDEPIAPIDERGLLRAGIALLGIWVLVDGATSLAMIEAFVPGLLEDGNYLASRARQLLIQRLSAGAQIVVGALLILSRVPVARALAGGNSGGQVA